VRNTKLYHMSATILLVQFITLIDGPRCAETLKLLFDNAKDPDNIIVGLIEQNDPEDKFCLEEYCSQHGVPKHYKRQTIRKDVTKVIAEPERLQCPRFNQVRLLAFHNKSAKGPAYARSMTRKILGNEEFCMQIDAHTSFSQNWDQIAKEEWRKTGNEFAVISNVPAKQGEQADYQPGGAKQTEVPRQCVTRFQDNGIPVRTKKCKENGMKKVFLLENTRSQTFENCVLSCRTINVPETVWQSIWKNLSLQMLGLRLLAFQSVI
jgi:hypothetical protein